MDNTPWFVFDNATGHIVKTGFSHWSDAIWEAIEGQTVVAGRAKDDERYVDVKTGELLDRPAVSLLVPLSSEATLADVLMISEMMPAGTDVEINSPAGSFTATQEAEEPLELELNAAGRFLVYVRPPFPWRECPMLVVMVTE